MANKELTALVAHENEFRGMVEGLKNTTLKECVKEYHALGKNTLQNTLKQFWLVNRVADSKAWEQDFKSIVEMYDTLFGLSKSQASRMRAIAKHFIKEDGHTIFYNEELDLDFSPTALVEMLPKGDEKDNVPKFIEDLSKVVESGKITANDNVKSVRATVQKEMGRESDTAKRSVKPDVERNAKTIEKLIDDLTAYAKKKNDKYLTTLASDMRKAIKK